MLRRMHRLNFLGQTETQLDYVGTHYSKDHRAMLADQSLQVEAWQSPFTTREFDSPAPHSSEQSNDQRSVPPGAY